MRLERILGAIQRAPDYAQNRVNTKRIRGFTNSLAAMCHARKVLATGCPALPKQGKPFDVTVLPSCTKA